MALITIQKNGRPPMRFKKGALHRQLQVPEGTAIPPKKQEEALAGTYGPLAQQRARFAFRGALATGRKTALRVKK